MEHKIVIYQLLPRLFSNTCDKCVINGSIEENGCGKMNDITATVLKEIKSLGATHVWYTGVIEHATQTDYSYYGIRPDNKHIVKGKAGSPYAIKDYYDVDPDIAESVPNRMAEFEQLVKRTHNEGLKVIIDFVPNHVARQYFSDVKPEGIEDLGHNDNREYFFSSSNNFYYITRQLFSPQIDLGHGDDEYFEFPAKATGNDCFTAFPSVNDWYETVKLNYGIDYGNNTRHFDPIPDTWIKMLHILRFWALKGIDGFRCDMAHMVPVEFWNWAIPQVKAISPNILFIAELYDVGIYRQYLSDGHFDYLYDKVNLYDTLRAIQCHNVSAANLTSCWQTVEGIGHQMLNFLENHDEQRIASQQFLGNAIKALPSLVVSTTMSKGPFLIYSGQEFGEKATDTEGFSGKDGRTTIFDYWSVPSIRRWYNGGKCDGKNLNDEEHKIYNVYKCVLNLINREDAIVKGDFFDLMYVNYNNPDFNPHRHYCYIRKHKHEVVLAIVNFSDDESRILVNIPKHAFDTLNMQPGNYRAVDLLSGKKHSIPFSESVPLAVNVGAYGALLLKFIVEPSITDKKSV